MCPSSQHIWQLVFNWFGVSIVNASSPRDHLIRFKIGWNNTQRRATLSVWMATVWTLWLVRNSTVFRGEHFNHERVLELIKRDSWHGLKPISRNLFIHFMLGTLIL